MRVARQSGGKTLLASYDGNTDTTTALAPKPPCLSGTRDSTTGSHLTWKTPDNRGSDIVNYLIFRGTTSGNEVQIGQTGGPKNSFEDTSADPNVAHYFYEVKAVNTASTPVGNVSNELDLQISVLPIETPCSLPGLTIMEDGANDELDTVPSHDVRKLSIGEPFAFASNKIVFTLKMQTLSNPLPPETEWPIVFDVGGVNYTVQMTTAALDGATAATPLFQVFKTSDGSPIGTSNADPASNFQPDGTITIVVPRSLLGNPALGAQLNNFLTRISDGTLITPDNMPQNFTPLNHPYTIVGNAFCAPNTAPLAALSANPLSGDPPLVVTFTPSGTDADAGDTIASYTIDFGDGSASAKQNCAATCPQIQHTYTTNGDFGVQLKVTDSRGKISSNTALVDIGVELPLDRVVSQKTHNGASGGPFPVILYDRSVYPNGNGEIECRAPGPENDYTAVFTFGPEFMVSNQASSVTVDGSTTSLNSQSFSGNTYTVHVKPTVPNAQHHVITLNGVPVTNSSKGGAQATLNNVGVRFDLLIGDTSGNGLVNSTDVSQVQAQSGQPVSVSNFRKDVNANGLINSTDISAVQSKSGTGLP
jgi:hypothetical protein